MRPASSSIFIVEDDPRFRETFMDVMALRGVDVQGASSGDEALRLLQELRPSVIVLDVQLPDIHGFELCRRIRKLDSFKKTPIVFVSASAQYSDPRDRAEGMTAGGSAFLPKPLTMDKLWGHIEPIVASGPKGPPASR